MDGIQAAAIGNNLNKWLLKLRGVLGIGLAGGIHWALSFVAIGTIIWVFDPDSIDPGEGPLRTSAIGAVVGFVSGVAFGTLMSLAEAGRAIPGISLARVAIWGIIGSAVFPLLTGRAPMVFILCPIGAVFAVALMVIARRAELRNPKPSGRLRNIFFASVLRTVRDAVNPPRASPR